MRFQRTRHLERQRVTQRRWSWILTGHFGRFLKRTVQSLCRQSGWVCLSVSVSERAAQSFFSSSYDWFMCRAVGFHSTFPKYHFTSKGSSSSFPSAETEQRRTVRQRERTFSPANVCLGSNDEAQDELYSPDLIMLNRGCINTSWLICVGWKDTRRQQQPGWPHDKSQCTVPQIASTAC